jgi:hypothetical protein
LLFDEEFESHDYAFHVSDAEFRVTRVRRGAAQPLTSAVTHPGYAIFRGASAFRTMSQGPQRLFENTSLVPSIHVGGRVRLSVALRLLSELSRDVRAGLNRLLGDRNLLHGQPALVFCSADRMCNDARDMDGPQRCLGNKRHNEPTEIARVKITEAGRRAL